MRFVDQTGKKFGHLTVLKRYASTDRRTFWECECACGNFTVVNAQKLVSGHTKTCGCRHGLPPEQRGIQRVRWIYERNARESLRSFSLSDAELQELVSQPCSFCGTPPSNSTNDGFLYSGIDRIDNTVGYTFDNCISCCWVCNQMKGTLSVDDFLTAINKIACWTRGEQDV